MSILGQVGTDSAASGMRIVIAGVEKIGKTTLVANAPNRLFVPMEVGYLNTLPNKTPLLTTYDELNALLDEIIEAGPKGKFLYKTISFDSVTALERFIHDKVLQTDPLWKNGNPKGLIMDNALGGYGKAYNLANELFNRILNKLDILAIHGGINIVFTAHVFADRTIDPTSGEYDSWNVLLHSPKNNKTYGKREMLLQWADLIGFIYEPVFINKQSDNLSVGVSANRGRILGLERTPGYVAGNRFGIQGEVNIGIEKPWNYLADAIYKASGINVFNTEE